METPPSTPPARRKNDALNLSESESDALRARVAAMRRKEIGQRRIYSEKESAALLAQVAEMDKERPYMPTPEKTTSAKEQAARQVRVTNFLADQVQELRMDIQGTSTRLAQMKRSPLLEALRPGKRIEGSGTQEDIEHLEDDIIGYKMQTEALTEALHAFEQNQPMPADAIATLHAIQERTAKELSRLHGIKQNDPSSTVSLEAPQRQLKLINDVLRDLGA